MDLRKQVSDLKAQLASLQLQVSVAEEALAVEEQKGAAPTVQEYLKTSVDYRLRVSKGVVVSGPGFVPFTVPGRSYPLGLAKIPMGIVERANVLNLSEFFRHLFDTKVSENILTQMEAFLAQDGRWATLQKVDLFVTPINVAKRDATGKNRGLDMPNVVFAFAFLITRHMECVILDPNYTGRDTHANIINLSRAMRGLFDMKLRVQTTIQPHMDTDDSFSYVFYMRAGGVPDEKTSELIFTATGTRNIMQVKVAPGKYDANGCGTPNWSAILDRFPDSCAMILHTFSMLDRFAEVQAKRTIRRIYFVLDSFSAYALYLSIAIKAYGLESCAVLLTYFKGQYSQMSLA